MFSERARWTAPERRWGVRSPVAGGRARGRVELRWVGTLWMTVPRERAGLRELALTEGLAAWQTGVGPTEKAEPVLPVQPGVVLLEAMVAAPTA